MIAHFKYYPTVTRNAGVIFINNSQNCVKDITCETSRGARRAARVRGKVGSDVMAAWGAGQGQGTEERQGCGAHAPLSASSSFQLSRWPSISWTIRSRRDRHVLVLYSVPFTSERTTVTDTGIRLNADIFYCVPGGIYAITLWTPTFLVHHLLSQSARLTRPIDMRQARDVVSIKNSNK